MLPADAPPVPEPFGRLPDVEGADPEFADPEFGDPEFPEPEFADPELDESGVEADPVFGVVAPDVPGVPGRFPQGELLDPLPGVVFGLIVEGFVVLPGVGGLVEFAPGTVDGGFGVGDGVVGVEGLPGGVVVLPEGDVVVPGLGWPAVPEAPAGEPPAGAACAITQEAQRRIAGNKKMLFAENTLVDNFPSDIGAPPAQILLCFLLTVTISSCPIARSIQSPGSHGFFQESTIKAHCAPTIDTNLSGRFRRETRTIR